MTRYRANSCQLNTPCSKLMEVVVVFTRAIPWVAPKSGQIPKWHPLPPLRDTVLCWNAIDTSRTDTLLREDDIWTWFDYIRESGIFKLNETTTKNKIRCMMRVLFLAIHLFLSLDLITLQHTACRRSWGIIMQIPLSSLWWRSPFSSLVCVCLLPRWWTLKMLMWCVVNERPRDITLFVSEWD